MRSLSDAELMTMFEQLLRGRQSSTAAPLPPLQQAPPLTGTAMPASPQPFAKGTSQPGPSLAQTQQSLQRLLPQGALGDRSSAEEDREPAGSRAAGTGRQTARSPKAALAARKSNA